MTRLLSDYTKKELKQEVIRLRAEVDSLRAAKSAGGAEPDGFVESLVKFPSDLHPATRNLVKGFAAALADKLARAEKKYGYGDGWMMRDWIESGECARALHEHAYKGDPRDVAAYCAFLWYHKASTKPDAMTPTPAPQGQAVEATWGEPELEVMARMAKALEEIERQTKRMHEGEDRAYSAVGTIALWECKESLRVYREWKRKPKLRPAPSAAQDAPAGEVTEGEPTDKEMLDWLDNEHHRSDCYPVAALTVKWHHDRNSPDWVNVSGPVRDAIRTAMRATQQPKEDGK